MWSVSCFFASFSGEKNFVYNGGIETDIDKFVESLTP